MICGKRKENYFCEADWTGQITLNWRDKSAFMRKRFADGLLEPEADYAARRMAKRYPSVAAKVMGFAKGSTHP
jgi:hypothetical protein